jgi:hypothetical protein
VVVEKEACPPHWAASGAGVMVSNHPGGKVCQVCRVVFETGEAKRIHATLDHPPHTTPLRFTMCQCARQVFIGHLCTCGRLVG